MPVITQERNVRTVAGLPPRWGVRAYEQLHAALEGEGGYRSERYKALDDLLDSLTGSKMALDMTEAQLCVMAENCANECANIALDVHDAETLLQFMALFVREFGIEPPKEKDTSQALKRCACPVWWRRSLRTVHRRTREHAAMRLGFVSSRAGRYCSDEAALSRVAQNRRNQKTLANTTLRNEETNQEFTLLQLSEKTTSNNKIRRGELMMRMAGCDQIAQQRGDKGLFVTLTCPVKFHAVMEKTGEPNPKYSGATPRDAQDHLREVFVLTRAANARDGIAPYGFRVAEPHHDGCTHWHMLIFMPAADIPVFVRNLSRYALAVDGDEYGAKEHRVTFKEIDPAQGGAAGYMAKYVGKNIGDNKLEEDMFGRPIITKEMRVDAWAGVWGIRQFQPIGQPPVTVWRELRRVPAGEVIEASECVRDAWAAVQRVYGDADPDTGEVPLVHAANWAEYITAQGGVLMGRDYKIGVATIERETAGRYGMTLRDCPIGIYERRCDVGAMPLYESVRYTWQRVGVAVGAAFDSTWSPVNNCTPPAWAADAMPGELVAEFDEAWFQSDEYQKIFVHPEVIEGHLIHAAICAFEYEDNRKGKDGKRDSRGA